jgi:DAHP synthetase I family
LVIVVGSCSVHDHDQAIAYGKLLKVQADQHAKNLQIVMRVYFEKPRTTVGWKGHINDPHLDGSFAMNQGLEMARQLLLDNIGLGLPVASRCNTVCPSPMLASALRKQYPCSMPWRKLYSNDGGGKHFTGSGNRCSPQAPAHKKWQSSLWPMGHSLGGAAPSQG